MPFVAAFTASLILSLNAHALPNPWSAVRTPAPGPAESIGTPTAGCLKGGDSITKSTPGIVLTRPERKRNFAHPRLARLLRELGDARAATKAGSLYLGDLAQPRGGPTMSAHASHQTGLDADVMYAKGAPAMVDTRRMKATPSFGARQVALLQSLAERPEMDRILVHYALKRELCAKHGQEAWIRKIRPWYGHDHHFHLRVKCAAGDTRCKDGEPIPEGNGCDASLDWWGSDEAKAESAKNLHRQSHPVMPELPAECGELVAAGAKG